MAAIDAKTHDLASCEGFRVESSDGPIGWVEETWLGMSGKPEALAVRTTDGRRALLVADDVLVVNAEQGWIVEAPDARLFELDAPRVETLAGDGSRPALAAWRTTGVVLAPPPPPRGLLRAALGFGLRLVSPSRAPGEPAERPLWQMVAILYGGIAFLVAFVVALAFVVAHVATGSAY